MPKIFLTKVWGFSPETYPALGFNTEGGRDKFLRESSPGDWVILAGTKGPPTRDEYRGRLLGRVQLGPELIDVEDVVTSVGTELPPDHYVDEKYRWPWGLPMIVAEWFTDRPDLAELFGDYLPGREWASFALDVGGKLGPDSKALIEVLRSEPASIVEAPEIVRQRERQRAFMLNRNRGNTGPGPSTERTGSQREPGAASVYLFQLNGGKRQAFKVGYSADPVERLAALNKGLLPSVTGCSWGVVQDQRFSNERQAYAFEQALHKRLSEHRVEGEQEVYAVERKVIDSAWVDVLYRGDWAGAEG